MEKLWKNYGKIMEIKFQEGFRVPPEHLGDDFPAKEGELNLYYGQIGSGKTYGATSDIWDDVRQGKLVYATWPVQFSAFDDRQSLFMVFMNMLLLRKRFYKIDCPKNFHYINAETGEVDGVPTFDPNSTKEYIEYLNSLNHCTIYIDEAWRVIDSYSKTTEFGINVRNLILVTRHKYRTINLIAQRPTSIQVTARANVNRFYKFVKLSMWPVPRFARYEFQDMAGETVDETKEPISIKTYFGKRHIFDSYNSFYYGALEPLHKQHFEAFDYSFKEKVLQFLYFFASLSWRKNKEIGVEKTLEK